MLLLVGPVAIMVAFGLSLDVESILRPRALVVVKSGSQGAELFQRFKGEFADRATIAGTTEDLEEATSRLLEGEVDAVITVPADPLGTVAGGERATLGVLYNTINPVFGTRVPARSYALVLDLNQSIVEARLSERIGNLRSAEDRLKELDRRLDQAEAAAETLSSEVARSTTAELDDSLANLEDSLESLQETEDAARALESIEEARSILSEVREAQEAGVSGRTGLEELRASLSTLREALAALPDVPPEVLANPLRLDAENLAVPPEVVGYYAPGVLSILVQHIAVSLASLAIVRERLSGAYEFFGVSPLGFGELLAGQFLAYFWLVLGVNLAVAGMLTGFLGVPIEGGFLRAAGAMALLTAASLGVGFSISAFAKSQLQAVQVSMLLLIASGFFAGFLFPLGEMRGPAVAVSYLLPATYGIRALQDVMIRGEAIPAFSLVGLLLIAAVTLGLARLLISRKGP